MHLRVLSQWLEDRVVIRHAARASALARVVRALLTGGKLSLTHLGRSLDGAAKEKHQIKAVDRLLGNQHLHGERDAIYAAIARTLLLGNLRPVVIVDWSDFELGRQWLMLKAAVPVGGRAISNGGRPHFVLSRSASTRPWSRTGGRALRVCCAGSARHREPRPK
jgi:hypothetical protein